MIWKILHKFKKCKWKYAWLGFGFWYHSSVVTCLLVVLYSSSRVQESFDNNSTQFCWFLPLHYNTWHEIPLIKLRQINKNEWLHWLLLILVIFVMVFDKWIWTLHKYYIYIIINVLWAGYWDRVDQCGRAIARWNRLGLKTMDQWKIFASRAPRARSARKCVFLLHKPP